MRIAIRMDDITADMDWKKFLKVKELLDAHGIRPLIGVVPENTDRKLHIEKPREDFWEYVQGLQRSGWTIAMHGYNHLYTTRDGGLFPIGSKSEFAGLSLQRQLEMIKKGKEILNGHGITTDIFMAPSHSFDKNTLMALRQNGFGIITDGFGTHPYRERGMIFYPISLQRSRSLEDKRDGLVTFVYHASTMDDKDFEKLKDLLSTGRVVSYDAYRDMDIGKRWFGERALQYLLAIGKRTLVSMRKR